jgi:hypothetical protein
MAEPAFAQAMRPHALVYSDGIMKTLMHKPAAGTAPRRLTIEGKRFELTVRPGGERAWHWLIAAPGEIVLSGQAASEGQALASAWQAAQALARLSAA